MASGVMPSLSILEYLDQPESDLDSRLKTKYEIVRLMSFHKTHIPASAILLAKAGFFQTGAVTKCFCCGVKLLASRWQINDKPFEIHRCIVPFCAHLMGCSDNIPIQREDDTPVRPCVCSTGIDVNGRQNSTSFTHQQDYSLRELHQDRPDISLSNNLRFQY